MPFFYEPCCDGDINLKLPRSLLPSDRPEVTPGKDDFYYPYAAFLLNKLPIYTEYAGICDHLPEGMLQRYLGLVEGKHSCWATKAGIEVDGSTTTSARSKQNEEEGERAAEATAVA